MTLILELPDNKEAALKAEAQAQGVSAEHYAAEVLNRDLDEGQPTSSSEPFWRTFTREMQNLPDEAFAHPPADRASEHDFYLYGSAKRKGHGCAPPIL